MAPNTKSQSLSEGKTGWRLSRLVTRPFAAIGRAVINWINNLGAAGIFLEHTQHGGEKLLVAATGGSQERYSLGRGKIHRFVEQRLDPFPTRAVHGLLPDRAESKLLANLMCQPRFHDAPIPKNGGFGNLE